MSSSRTRILVAGPAWVGDMVMAQSLFMTLKQQDPEAIIDVVAPAWSVPLLKRMPEVNEAIELPVGHKQLKLLKRYAIGRALRINHYDRAIVTPRSYKSALIPFFAKAKQRTGYRGEMRYGVLNDIRGLDKSILRQTVQRYVALALPAEAKQAPEISFPRLTIDEKNQQTLVNELGLATNKPIIGFMPGAEYGPAKQWPVDYFNELAGLLNAKGVNVWVFGSKKEQGIGNNIAAGNNNVTNLAGRTELVDVIDLLALTDYTVTNDSGLMHVACAADRKVIAIYGSSDPGYTPPLSNHAVILYNNLECSPCFDRRCKFGHTDCLKQIRAAEVMINLPY